jgi:hypothetical protein
VAGLRNSNKAHDRNIHTVINQLVTSVNEQRTDHATAKTCIDVIETLVEELHDDHATMKTSHDAMETLVEELKADVNLLRSQVLNQCKNGGAGVGGAGLAEGTNANTFKTVNAVSYTIDGQLYTKGATDNITFTATAQQAISTFCLYLVSINSGGTVTVTKGTEVGTDIAVLPALPASSAPLGWIKVATDGATTFTGGTTDLGAAGITDTYGDISVMNTGASASTAISASDPASGPATLSASKPASFPATLSAAACDSLV